LSADLFEILRGAIAQVPTPDTAIDAADCELAADNADVRPALAGASSELEFDASKLGE
jgi:hypothetical protein